MTDWKLNFYHRLPPALRSVVASARGYYLRSWRYSKETEALVEEALVRDYWSAEQWKVYQENRLAYVLHRSATKVPYYKEQWAERRRRGDRASWDYLENWPLLDKEPVRVHSEAFLAEDCRTKRIFHDHTSGTTGKPLKIFETRETVLNWYALVEARWRRWYGVTRHDRWAIMGGQLVTPVEQSAPPFWVWNQGLNQLYLSSYHLAPQHLSTYIDALQRYKIKYIYSYTSSVFTLAQEILRVGYHVPPDIDVIITNAEPLYQHQRETISSAFNCPVRETYGMSELVLAAGECDQGYLHLWPEVGFLEFAEQDEVVNHAGELICTSLLNADMPLIRYRIGDRARLLDDVSVCPCRCHLPRIGQIEGRQDDMIYTSDGRSIGRLDPVFKSTFPLREAQIIQDTLSHIRVLCVPDEDYTDQHGRLIIERLRERLGPTIEVSLETVPSIPRTSNGKFRAVVSNLSSKEKERLRGQ